MSAADEHAPRQPARVDRDEQWILEEEEDRPTRSGRRREDKPLPPGLQAELAGAAGQQRAGKLHDRLAVAVQAYDRDRYQEARRLLRALADEAPTAPAVRELLGLTHYRLGNWRAAIKELEAFHALTDSHDQHPVLADCYRALHQPARALQVWEQLRQASPGVELVAEGRIVAAGALADRDDLAGAIALLTATRLDVKNPKLHHLRQWYALADLYERAGELPRARELFGRILHHDPEFFDVADRRRALG